MDTFTLADAEREEHVLAALAQEPQIAASMADGERFAGSTVQACLRLEGRGLIRRHSAIVTGRGSVTIWMLTQEASDGRDTDA